jgi:hypothetical protein
VPGDCAEHADEREQAAAFAPAEDRAQNRQHAVDQQEDSDDDVNVLSVSWGEATKNTPTPRATAPNSTGSHHKLVMGRNS